MKDDKKLSVLTVTKDQRNWLNKETARTGETIATVQRGLIQEKIQAEKDIADKAKQLIN